MEPMLHFGKKNVSTVSLKPLGTMQNINRRVFQKTRWPVANKTRQCDVLNTHNFFQGLIPFLTWVTLGKRKWMRANGPEGHQTSARGSPAPAVPAHEPGPSYSGEPSSCSRADAARQMGQGDAPPTVQHCEIKCITGGLFLFVKRLALAAAWDAPSVCSGWEPLIFLTKNCLCQVTS